VVRTVRVRLELDRNDYKQGLRDAANDMRTFDGEVKTLGKDAEKTGGQLKDSSTTARKLGDDAKKSSRDITDLGQAIGDTKKSLHDLGDEYKRTGAVEMDRYRQLTGELKKLERAKRDLDKLIAGDGKGGGMFNTGLKAGDLFEGIFTDFSGTAAKLAKAMVASPELLAIGGAIAVPIGAGLGAALSGAVLAGTAGAGLAAGILLAGRSSEVHDAWTIVANDALNGFSNAASSFQEPLVRAAKVFDDALASDMPRIRRDFEILAPLVDDLAKGTAGLFHNVIGGPGLQDAFRGAIPVIKELSADLPKLGDDIDRFFSELGGTGRAGAQALGIAVDVTGASLRGLGTVLAETSTLFELTGTGALGLLHDLGVLGDTADILTASPLASLSQILGGNKNSSDDFSKSLEQLKNDMADAGSQKAFEEGMKTAAAALREGQAAARDMEHQVSDLANTLLGTKDADIAFKQGLLDLNQTLRDNKGATDERTKAGLDDEAAILAQFHAAVQLRDATLQQKNDQEAANKVFDDAVGKIYATAQAHGIDKQKVDELSGSIRDIPRPDPVDIELKRLGYSDDDLREMKRGLLTMPSADPHIDLRRQGYSDDDIRELGREVNGLPSYHRISVEVAYSTTGSAGTGAGRAGAIRPIATGGVISYASGGVHDYKMSLRPDYTARSGLLKPSNPGTILAGEPSTGGEVFGPRLGVSHERGLQLAGVLAGWHGGMVVRPAATTGGGGTVSVELGGRVELTLDGRKVGELLINDADHGGTAVTTFIRRVANR
jgi:hypothetical protein